MLTKFTLFQCPLDDIAFCHYEIIAIMGQEDYLLISELIFIKIIKFLQSIGIKPETSNYRESVFVHL